MYQRVLLVAPPSSSYLGAAMPPSGLGYLAQSLLEAGIGYAVEDMRVRGRSSTLQKRIRDFQPDLIGFSLVSLEYKRSYELIRQIKELHPRISIVAGGAHVSALQESVLEECRALDFGIVGEAEQALLALCRGERPLEEIPGLYHWRNGTVVSGPERKLISDLDTVPFPRFIHFDLKKYTQELPLVTSRGCPYKCIFCPHSIMSTGFRARSAANVVDEIEYWYHRGARHFAVDDDNFTLIKERVYEICDEIERRRLKDLFIRCANGIRADRVDRDLLTRLKEVGVREVGFGADGGNNRVLLDIVHTGETIDTIERAIQDAIDVGLQVRLFIIVGHPGETMSDVEDSFALAQRYPLIRLHLNNPVPYPGTELFEWVQNQGCFLMSPEEYLNNLTDSDTEPVFETPELPADVRRQIMVRARKIESRVWRRAAERMLGDLPLIPTVAGRLLASRLGRWLFFKNTFTRSVINQLRYRIGK
ncbi:MAG TPA: radical SAM protein [Anaerolineae bacterium]|nr:radical SAM protein [Anaerolineae bacterium]